MEILNNEPNTPLDLIINGKRISLIEIVIVRKNEAKGVIEFGTKKPESFKSNGFGENDTYGTVPYSEDTYERILMAMPQISKVIETKNNAGFIVVEFTDGSLARYDAKLLPIVREMEETQQLKAKVRQEKIEKGRKTGQHAVVRKLATAVASTVFCSLAMATLTGCNITITGNKELSKSFTLSMGSDAPAKNDPPKPEDQAAVQTNEPIKPAVQETAEQAECRKSGIAMWKDLVERNPKMMIVDGYNEFHEVNITGSEQLSIDYFSFISGIKSTYMEAMTEAEIDSYLKNIFNFGHMMSAVMANPNNTDSEKVNPTDYMSSNSLTTIANNTYAVMQNAFNASNNDPRRYDVDTSLPSEKAKFSRNRAEDEILLAYANSTIGNDALFDQATDGFKFMVLDALSFGLSAVPMYRFIVDEYGQELYHTYFERNEPYMTWVPILEGEETIFYESICGNKNEKIGTYYRMQEVMKDWNDDNSNVDMIQEWGIAKAIEDASLALQSDVITRPSSNLGKAK